MCALRWVFCSMLLTFAVVAAEGPAEFELLDINGQLHRLSDYRGKWVVVNYWATWCPPCREELPELEVFHNNHQDKDAVVLGVNMERISDERLKQFVDEQFLSFPILRTKPAPGTELGQVPGLPTSYLIAPSGEAVARQVGPLTVDHLESFIQRYREDKPAGGSR